ncbi:hypothetical protein JMJ35_000486 [Cladonia borealis]|uniref:Uncharacterized protein n=1 Tax=Cladonia borealis TaxID=184061 RepID=A0AA39UF80_9LECA|nr:hypothetical protein JMJ35_000486 [Cladonia borealis]
MAGVVPQKYSCYMMTSPAPADAPAGLVDKATGRPLFFVKFGDGKWDNRYPTHNPSFEPGHTDECANVPTQTKFYNSANGPVNAGTYLESVICRPYYQQNITSEWYKVRGQPGAGQQLAQGLQQLSDILDNLHRDFGYTAAMNARQNGLAAQRAAATATFNNLVTQANNLRIANNWN